MLPGTRSKDEKQILTTDCHLFEMVPIKISYRHSTAFPLTYMVGSQVILSIYSFKRTEILINYQMTSVPFIVFYWTFNCPSLHDTYRVIVNTFYGHLIQLVPSITSAKETTQNEHDAWHSTYNAHIIWRYCVVSRWVWQNFGSIYCPHIILLKPSGYVMHHQFNIQQLYALYALHLCVLYLSENKQRLVPLTA